MVNYSYNFLALLVLFAISTSLLSRWKTKFTPGLMFSACIIINITAAIADLLSYCTIYYAKALPRWVNYLSNTFYYFCIFTLMTSYAIYVTYQLMSHRDREEKRKQILLIYGIVYVVFCALLVVNLFTGIIFSFDNNMRYIHGPLRFVGYIFLIYLTLTALFYAVTTRGFSGGSYIGTVKHIIPVIYLLILFKILYPSAHIESFIGAVTGMFIFIHLQDTRPESDPVTRLGNLDSFIEYIRYLEKKKQEFQIILISLRDFGSINSAVGYVGGNEILMMIAHWLEEFYHSEKVFRYGPVSFAVVLPRDTFAESDKAVHHIIDSFPQSWLCDKQLYHISAYFVDYVCEKLEGDPYKVVETLDYARKQTRDSTKDHIHYNDELAEELNKKKELIEYLKHAIKKKQFEVFLQPIYSGREKRFTTAEALIRLKDKDGRFISPEYFTIAAEESKLDYAINRQLIDAVCSFLGSCRELPIESVSINLTMQQLQDMSFSDSLINTMKKYSVPQGRIALEVTERIILSKDSAIQLSLFKLRLAGFKLLLDDFGTGYSNFSSLLRCKFDKIKLDKSLLDDGGEKRSLDIVSTLIELFHNNGQEVVIEGIETKEQCDAVLEAGVDYIQGYYYSKPIPMHDYLVFVSEHNY